MFIAFFFYCGYDFYHTESLLSLTLAVFALHWTISFHQIKLVFDRCIVEDYNKEVDKVNAMPRPDRRELIRGLHKDNGE